VYGQTLRRVMAVIAARSKSVDIIISSSAFDCQLMFISGAIHTFNSAKQCIISDETGVAIHETTF
jgi:hypothetical protein